ncbi:MAG: alpha/beta fold hydrolase [Acidimicrobiia bacterium]|nr:MAG: alpha/beta fold hydrolase [Acidimicrobiia bacterium]
MTQARLQPAVIPPPGLEGLDPRWSRLVETPGLDERGRTWHILDNQVAEPSLTLLCVHGNPTWSYLWRDLLAAAPRDVRVVAIDHLDMGFSERTGTTRRLVQRIDDLSALTEALGIDGPVVTVAHDWGGPISLGWAERHLDQLAGVILMNTAVHQPEGSSAPALIRAVRTPGLLDKLCVSSLSFVRGAMALSRPRPSKAVRDAYEAPYLTPDRRHAIAGFVEDIPLSENHPTAAALDQVAAGLAALSDTPTLLLWGPSDPVFSDLYLRDLAGRLPTAVVHRYIGASHMLPEDADIAAAVFSWLADLDTDAPAGSSVSSRTSLWSAIERRADDDTTAMVDLAEGDAVRQVSFRELAQQVSALASGLADIGVSRGDRIALLVPPSIDLAVALYGTWRAGATVVLVDAGLGVRGISRALKSANPDYIVGVTKALAVARTMRWPGVRISTSTLSEAQQRALGIEHSLEELLVNGADLPVRAEPTADDIAAVAFTSGSTGPAKGVVYRHHQVQAQRDALIDLYDIQPSDRLVAAFGPFALFGPGIGITSVVPEMKVTSPGSLTATALADAARAIDATMVFGSPAAFRNVTATAGSLAPRDREALFGVRLMLAAGAPVDAEILRAAHAVMPNAEPHTPYGMTEMLPVADISLEGIDEAGSGLGVCVGYPLDGVDVTIDPLDGGGEPSGDSTTAAGVAGEVCVRGPHMRDGYDKLWFTQHTASQPPGWHRTGDVGHFDSDGRLWIEGRVGHVISTMYGPVTPIGLEHAINSLDGVELSAIVGVGPRGTQQVVAVIVQSQRTRKPSIVSERVADNVRSAIPDVDVAAVLSVPGLPVDKRHNSKIDRTRIAMWAERVLAGGRMGRI